MQTVYDWVTIALFAALIVLFLQRSVGHKDGQPPVDERHDSLWHYLAASVGLAVANYLGNEGYAIPAWALILGVCVYAYVALKPFAASR
jgi:hypothetical protein